MGLIRDINPLNAELNPICHLLALLGAQHILYVSRIRVKRIKLLSYPISILSSAVVVITGVHLTV
jgi:hypothetical protein